MVSLCVSLLGFKFDVAVKDAACCLPGRKALSSAYKSNTMQRHLESLPTLFRQLPVCKSKKGMSSKSGI